MIKETRRIVGASAVFFATIHADVAHAAWPSDPNVNAPLCTTTNDQVGPTIVSDGAGGAIVTWGDNRSGTSYDIYAQRVNAVGLPQWTADGIALCTATNSQASPMIVSDHAGGAIVTWYDRRSGSNNDIYVQRVSASGTPQWTADGVALCTATNDQNNPTVVSDGSGGAIITWYDRRSGDFDIYAQRVNSAGVPQWTADGVALCAAAKIQEFPAIASDGAGGAIVTWQDFRNGTASYFNYDIFAQRVNAAGAPQWTADGVALCTSAFSQISPAIVPDGAGGAIVAWQGYRSGTNYDIDAQRVNAAGMPQWTADGVALCAAPSDQSHPMIASDRAGGAIVTWQDYRSGTDADIYCQRASSAGVPKWTANGVALCTAANGQYYPTIASDDVGGAIVTWQDQRSGANYDIYAQRVNTMGTAQWTGDGVVLSTAANDQLNPASVSDGAAGAIATWQDQRDGNADIYAQNVNADGTLGRATATVPRLALLSIQPNPSVGDLRISFSLVDFAPAMLELYDLTGRRIESQSVGSLGPGAHVTALSSRTLSLPPGIYCVRLTQGGRRTSSKVAIVR